VDGEAREGSRRARASGVRLEKVSGTLDLDWIALTDSERHVAGSPGLFAKHALLLAVGARFRRLRSSMLAAIERGRPPAVDFLNGEVSTRGERLGIPTPINSTIREQVLGIARGKGKPSLELARGFFDRTRAPVTAEALAIRAVPPVEVSSVGPGTTDMMEPLPAGLVMAPPMPTSPTIADDSDAPAAPAAPTALAEAAPAAPAALTEAAPAAPAAPAALAEAAPAAPAPLPDAALSEPTPSVAAPANATPPARPED